jgi:hypothetical protein
MTNLLEDHTFDSYISPFGARSEPHRLRANKRIRGHCLGPIQGSGLPVILANIVAVT